MSRVVNEVIGDKAVGYEAITVSTVAKALTATTYGDAKHAFITVETKGIRYRLDGEAPTATEGHYAASGTAISLNSANQIANFKAIRGEDADATIRVTYSVCVI